MAFVSASPHDRGKDDVCDERPPKLAQSEDEAPARVSAPLLLLIFVLTLLGAAFVVGLATAVREGLWQFL
jgi:hypothetical protein